MEARNLMHRVACCPSRFPWSRIALCTANCRFSIITQRQRCCYFGRTWLWCCYPWCCSCKLNVLQFAWYASMQTCYRYSWWCWGWITFICILKKWNVYVATGLMVYHGLVAYLYFDARKQETLPYMTATGAMLLHMAFLAVFYVWSKVTENQVKAFSKQQRQQQKGSRSH